MTHYIPFGRNCAIALILRQAGLRQESLPFDWVLGEPQHIKRSLDVRFEDWFMDGATIEKDEDKGIELINEKEAKGLGTVHPNYYIPKTLMPNGTFFTHMNMTDPDVKKTMKKRIDRFYSIIESDEPVVFVSSIPSKILDEYGLLDYFDRDVKFLIFTWKRSGAKPARVSKFINHNVLTYTGPEPFHQTSIDNAVSILTSPEFSDILKM
jgi:hypothetical protein